MKRPPQLGELMEDLPVYLFFAALVALGATIAFVLGGHGTGAWTAGGLVVGLAVTAVLLARRQGST